MPNRNDQAALQKFFFDEIQKGEELLAAGEWVQAQTMIYPTCKLQNCRA